MKKFWMLLWIWGFRNGFIQEGETASESFIPDFDYEGVEKILHKWKEAGTFVPARMKKEKYYRKFITFYGL